MQYSKDAISLRQHFAAERGSNVYDDLGSKVPAQPTDILVLPHFSGAANPYMDSGSKAAIVGLTLEHTNYDLYKALMEGVTYEMMINVEHLQSFGICMDKLVATGGGASSPVWLQIKADVLNRPVTTIEAKEAGACGTCMLTAVAVGLCSNLHETKKVFVKEKQTYVPQPGNAEKYAKNYKAYNKLYSGVRPVIRELYNN
ncbi:MAG: hypothetical protein IJ365_06765 [Clostridia bacterium]|nr:hypothetical protein [Clostridia bacterium]